MAKVTVVAHSYSISEHHGYTMATITADSAYTLVIGTTLVAATRFQTDSEVAERSGHIREVVRCRDQTGTALPAARRDTATLLRGCLGAAAYDP